MTTTRAETQVYELVVLGGNTEDWHNAVMCAGWHLRAHGAAQGKVAVNEGLVPVSENEWRCYASYGNSNNNERAYVSIFDKVRIMTVDTKVMDVRMGDLILELGGQGRFGRVINILALGEDGAGSGHRRKRELEVMPAEEDRDNLIVLDEDEQVHVFVRASENVASWSGGVRP